MREMMIYDLEHLYRAGYGDRLRPTLKHSKRRMFKENGPMERAVLERIIRTTECGLAMVVGSGLLALDKDGPNVGPFADLTSLMAWDSSRGENSLFHTDIVKGTNKLKFKGLEVDILCNDNSIITIPPSELVTGMARRWKAGIHKLADLPLFPSDLLKEARETPPVAMPRIHQLPTTARIEGMRRWIGFKFAESGEGGDAVTFKVAVKIVSVVKDFDAAMAEILRWDRTNAIPPWSDTKEGLKALEHKVRCAIKYLLKGG